MTMYMASLRDAEQATGIFPASPRHARAEAATPAPYTATKRSWGTLVAILLAHVAVLAALVKFDVIQVARRQPPQMMSLVPLEIAPPPPPAAAEPQHKPKLSNPQIVAPVPIVVTPQATPPMAAVTAPQPPAPVAPPTPGPAAAPAAAPAPVSIGTLAAMPGNPPLVYPKSARMRHQEGVALLRILIGTDGRVADIALAQSSGFDVLDRAAMEVVRFWRFAPAKRDGIAVEGVGIFPATFKLRKA